MSVHSFVHKSGSRGSRECNTFSLSFALFGFKVLLLVAPVFLIFISRSNSPGSARTSTKSCKRSWRLYG